MTEPVLVAETVDPVVLAARLAQERAADIVEALNRQARDVAAAVLLRLPAEKSVEAFDQPGLLYPAKLIGLLPRERAAALLAGMSADRAADVVRQLRDPVRSELMARVDPETRAALRQLLVYPEGTVGSMMTTEFVSVPSSFTVEDAIRHIRKVERTRETVYAIFVLDPGTGALLNAVTLRRLIAGDPSAPVLSAAPERRPISLAPEADRDEAARLISKYDLLAVPVVDPAGRVIGIVTVDDIIDAMVQASTEEVQRFGGVGAVDEPYPRVGFVEMIRKRAGWLCVLFLSEMLTASAMQTFEAELEKAIVLTLFIPLIMSSGGNSGSQATSLLIRALALGQLALRDWWRVALREVASGLVLGGILGAIGIARIALWQQTGLYDYCEHWLLVALTVGAALVGIVTFGSVSGSMLPFVLQRVGFDPATASAPFVATLVDVTGLVIYFGAAAMILKGTLL